MPSQSPEHRHAYRSRVLPCMVDRGMPPVSHARIRRVRSDVPIHPRLIHLFAGCPSPPASSATSEATLTARMHNMHSMRWCCRLASASTRLRWMRRSTPSSAPSSSQLPSSRCETAPSCPAALSSAVTAPPPAVPASWSGGALALALAFSRAWLAVDNGDVISYDVIYSTVSYACFQHPISNYQKSSNHHRQLCRIEATRLPPGTVLKRQLESCLDSRKLL